MRVTQHTADEALPAADTEEYATCRVSSQPQRAKMKSRGLLPGPSL